MTDILADLIEAVFGIVADASAPPAKWLYIVKASGGTGAIGGSLSFATLTEGAVSGIYDYIRFMALGLTIVYFLFEMNQKIGLEGRDLTMKSFFAPFLKFMIALAAITQSGKIVGWILSFNDNFIKKVEDITTGTIAIPYDTMSEQMANAGATLGFFMAAFMILFMMIAFLLGLILQLVWGYKAIMYKLEVLFRLAILPIAVADVYNGQHSTAIRYIKGFLVMGIVAVSYIALPHIATQIAAATLITNWDGATMITFTSYIQAIGTLLVAPFAAIAATGVAKQIAKEALGA